MTKKKTSKKKPTRNDARPSAVPARNNSILFAMLSLIAVFAVGYLLVAKSDRTGAEEEKQAAPAARKSLATRFKKEGELRFINKTTGEIIKKIDIEIADNEYKRVQGLMYRSSMPDSAGMLFIFDNSQLRSFWMKNTIIPLDIIYINEKKEIVTIQKYTKPFSEASIFSYKKAQYVVEVNAGFCDKYNVREGDRIRFSPAQ